MRVCAKSWTATWFESGREPVYAESSETKESALVRLMLLPAEWIGRQNIRCADRPTRQGARVFLEEPLA